MIHRLPAIAILFLAISTWAGADSANSENQCGQCNIKEAAVEKLRGAEKEYTQLLARNQEYLSSLKPGESSKAIKLRSNITMININLDGVRDSIVSANLEITKQCRECNLTAQTQKSQGE